jgi:two-component system, NarL family, nitrate/nitrite response regulator NarL
MSGLPDRIVRVVIADDESIFRTSLRQLLTAPPSVIRDVYGIDVGAGFEVVGEASNGHDTIATVAATAPDLLLLDLNMPRISGLSALRELQQYADTMHTIVLSGQITQAHLLAAFQLGVRAIVGKGEPTEAFFEAIMSVLTGGHWLGQNLLAELIQLVRAGGPSPGAAARNPFGLTPREREVLTLVAAGYPNKEIARTCAVSEETVKHHLTRMFDKVGAANRLELAKVAAQIGLVNEP